MKKLKPQYPWSNIIKCPICKSKTFEHVSYFDDGCCSTVEQHGYCHRCGYIIEQAYSPAYDAFRDIKKGFKHPTQGYIEKNIKRHKRIRRKLGIKNIDVNPEWINYI